MFTLGTQADEGVHIVLSEQVALSQRLYVDLFENRTPAVEWLLGLTFKWIPISVTWGRYLGLMISLLTISALIVAGRSLYRVTVHKQSWFAEPSVAGWSASLLFTLAPLAIFWGRFVMLENWQTAMATLSIASALLGYEKRKPIWWLAAGLLAGLSVLMKQSGLILVGVMLLYFALGVTRIGEIRPRKAILYWFLGLLFIIGAFILYLITNGALSNFYQLLSGIDRLDPFSQLSAKVGNFASWGIRGPYLILAIFGVVAVIKSRAPVGYLVVMWAAAELLALFLTPDLEFGWGGFSHYVLPALAALSLLAGFGIVQLFYWLSSRLRFRVGYIIALLVVLLTGIPWLIDLSFSVNETSYPQPDTKAEERIGRAIASVTPDSQPILVLANSIFHHWAERPIANFYFHYPGYLPRSALASESEKDIVETLETPGASAVLVSRMHFEERLPETIIQALWQNWSPIAYFSYPYQQDVFLFKPIQPFRFNGSLPLAEFETGIELMDISVDHFEESPLLISLDWKASDQSVQNLIAFVHLLSPEGELIAQHDGVPVVGFRPSTSWAPNEVIHDSHWLDVSKNFQAEGYYVSVGLYDASSGRRLSIVSSVDQIDSYILPLSELGN